MTQETDCDRVLRMLERRVAFEAADREAIRALPIVHRTLEPSTYFAREGERTQNCAILLSGFAYRHKITGDGQRQILSVNMPGDFLDLQNSLLGIADHNVQALTRCEIAVVTAADVLRLAGKHPRIAGALWVETLIEASIFREWIVNVGRRDSITRIAHLLCEFGLRLHASGLAVRTAYDLPMTQEQIADCTGLTPVHVNRVLKELGRRALIERHKRAVTIVDWERLREVGDFNSRYLHLAPGEATAIARAA